MLTACAASRTEAPHAKAPDPVIEQRRVEVRVCPAELSAAIPAKPEPGKDAMLTGNDAGMAWLGALGDWAALLLARLVDARGQC